MSVAPVSSRGNPGPGHGIRAATLFAHARQPHNSHNRERAADPTGHAQSSPHRDGCRALAGSHLRQTSFLYRVRLAIEHLPSGVSSSVLLSVPRVSYPVTVSTACKPAFRAEVSRCTFR